MTSTPSPTPLRRPAQLSHLQEAERALGNARAARADLAAIHEAARQGSPEPDSRTLQRYSRRINNAVEVAQVEAQLAQAVALDRLADAVERLALAR
jgi:hypothetical protein